MTTQGAKANRNGKIFEEMMIPIFQNNGFLVFKETELYKKPINIQRYIIKDASYINIYSGKGKTEFVIVDGNRRIRIEAKYQSVSGSVDEKLPYMYLNAINQYPENEVIFVVDGGGYREGARKWLDESIDKNLLNSEKNIKLMDIMQFVAWFNHEFSN